MAQTTNRFFDDIARLMTDAAGAADGVRREVETVVKSQIERLLREMDVARREEVDVLRDMVVAARGERAARVARQSPREPARCRSRFGRSCFSANALSGEHPHASVLPCGQSAPARCHPRSNPRPSRGFESAESRGL